MQEERGGAHPGEPNVEVPVVNVGLSPPVFLLLLVFFSVLRRASSSGSPVDTEGRPPGTGKEIEGGGWQLKALCAV